MKKTLSILTALVILLSLTACGASSDYTYAAEMPEPAYSDNYAAPAAYDSASGLSGGSYLMEEDYAPSGAEATVTESEEGEAGSSASLNPDKIIYSASATVETTDFEKSVEGVNELVKTHGGFIESSSVNGVNYYNKSRGNTSTRSASYVLRIPSRDFNAVMNSLSTLGNVPYSNTYSDNISGQYYDTRARLNAYKTQEESLLRMMEVAESVEDILSIEDRLTTVRYNIESLQTTLNGWDRKVDFSTIDLTVKEVIEYTPETEKKISWGREVWLSLVDGVKGTVETVKDFIVWFVGALPALLVLTGLFFLFRPLLRRINTRRKEKRAAKRTAGNETEK